METNINSKIITIEAANIHYLEAGEITASPVLFLHGASFSAQTWQEIGSLTLLVTGGYRVIAVDLPGYSRSETTSFSFEDFLAKLLLSLNINLPILISPSMSGSYSLPFIINNAKKLKGFVAIAPVGIPQFARQLEGIELPTLAVWGSDDRIIPAEQADLLIQSMPNAQKVILAGAGHACYLKATHEFHQHLLQFIKNLDS